MASTSMPATGKLLISAEPATSVLDYHHLGLAVGDVVRSCSFFEKLGFQNYPELCVKESVVVMKSSGGLYVQIFKADRPVEDERNLLMDFPDNKYPGHTHASFTVPSVPAAREFLESLGIAISGERKPMGRLRAVFIRDPDRTTFEFEKNVGEDDALPGGFTPAMVGNKRRMDHVGIRVRDPEARLMWYAEKLGFTREVMSYPADPNPLKNERPWITRTPTDCDINFIINANTPPEEPNRIAPAGGGEVRPGLVYVAFSVADAAAAAAGLAAAGVPTVAEDQVTRAEWGLDPAMVGPAGGPSLFLRDPDGTLLRLVQEP